MRVSELEALRDEATTDVVTAGRLLGISRDTSYKLAGKGDFPVPVLRAGNQYRVPVISLLKALGLDYDDPPEQA